jgi:hypothetical protein
MSKTVSKTSFGQSKIVQLKKPIGQVQNPSLVKIKYYQNLIFNYLF